MFLKEVVSRKYDGDSDEVVKGTVYRFATDGSVSIEQSAKPFAQAAISDSHADVAKDREPRPAFGEYARLIVKDR